jgi:hypothetical protein
MLHHRTRLKLLRRFEMARNVGDRYACEKCGAVLVYEKACPCSQGNPHSHSEICCGQQMKAVGKETPKTTKA